MRSHQLRTLAKATPQSRDRTVDLLRAGAVLLVVLGHWLAVGIWVEDGVLTGQHVLALVPAAQPLTWWVQVMPLFFVLGGWAGAASWRSSARRGTPTTAWVQRRLVRLLRPTTVFVAAGAAGGAVARLAGVDAALVRQAGWLAALALWFLAVYVVASASVPVLVRAHDRWGLAVPAALAAGTAGADAARLVGDLPAAGALPWATTWGCFTALGVAWQAGALRRPGLLLAGGAVTCVLLVALGPYPVSMVSVPGDTVHNASPPGAALLALGAAHCGLAMLAAPWLARRARHRPVWVLTVAINATAMTLYLWHLVPVVLGALLVLAGGFPDPVPGTALWWLTRPLWVALLAGLLVVLVAVAGRFEVPRPSVSGVEPRPGAPALLAVGVAGAAAGLVQLTLAGLSGAGPAGLPLAGLTTYAVGAAAVALAVRRVRHGR